MQVSGIGSNHGTEHHVTECIHSHAGEKKGAAAKLSGGNENNLQQSSTVRTMPDGQLSLAAWLKNTFGIGKKLLQSIWGGSTEEISAAAGDDKGMEALRQVAAQEAEQETTQMLSQGFAQNAEQHSLQNGQPDTVMRLHNPQIAAAAATVQSPQNVQQNPYFSAIQDTGRRQETLWEKIKVRFRDITGHLTRQFSGKNSFQAKQEQTKEDLRRHSRYRQDDVEIDCIITDDSYLLDSYDKKGEYSKLSAGK